MEMILQSYRSEANALFAKLENNQLAFEKEIEPIIQKHITEYRKKLSPVGSAQQNLGDNGERHVTGLLESMITINRHILGLKSNFPE